MVFVVGSFALAIHNLAYMRLIEQRAARGQICGKCLYDVSGVTGPICPECGKAITRPASAATQTTETKPSPPPTDAPH